MQRSLKAAVSALALGVFAIGDLSPKPASAQLAVVCATCDQSWTQLLEYGKQLQQVETQLNQYSTQLQQYANMVQNTVAVPTQVYSSAMSDMNRVRSLMDVGSNLNFSNMSNMGASVGTFSSYMGNVSSLPTMAAKYQQWTQQAKDNLSSAMQAAGAQRDQLSTDDATMRGLQAQNASAAGQMQAIQNGAQISAQGARETEKLRELVMLQVQMEASQHAIQADQQADAAAREQAFLNVPKPSITGGQGY